MKRILQVILVCVFISLFVTFCRGAEVVKSEVQGQSFIADFYCRQDSTNRLGILLLGGSEGGKPHGYFARFLATNGYPTLALAYFKEKGLPEGLQSIPLEYFDKAIAWMETNQQARVDRVVVFGASRGAELALLLASTNPKINGVIALSPSSVVWFGVPPMLPCSSWTLGGKPVPYMPYYGSSNFVPSDLHVIYKKVEESLAQKELVEKAVIKVEQIHGPILLASGHDDPYCPSEEMADAICSRLKEKGFKYRFENLKYPDAGHTLDERWMIGGTFEGNKKARIDLDERVLVFLKAIE